MDILYIFIDTELCYVHIYIRHVLEFFGIEVVFTELRKQLGFIGF